MSTMNFLLKLQDVKAASSSDPGYFERLMDELAAECTDEQWAQVVQELEEERLRLDRVARDVEQRLARVPTIRPVKEDPVPGVVWVVLFEEYSETTLVDVCETRLGAIESAELHAGGTRSRKTPWKERWKRNQVDTCRCPVAGCDHERWEREMRGTVGVATYTVQSWSTTDGKWREGADGNV